MILQDDITQQHMMKIQNDPTTSHIQAYDVIVLKIVTLPNSADITNGYTASCDSHHVAV